jgi:hypothetical protein
MNFLIVILNRVYLFLTIAKNQSPLFGASGILMLLIYATLNNLLLFFYAFKSYPLRIESYIDFIEMGLIFIGIYYYAYKNKQKVINHSLYSGLRNNLIVILLYIFTVMSFILLANINRQKISEQTKKEQSNKPRKESLEGKIRKWFE